MNSQHRPTLISRRRAAKTAGIAGMSLLLSPAAFAQESTPAADTAISTPVASPAAAPVAEPTITNLMTAAIDQLPEAPFTVRMLRITLQPGAITPMHMHHGPEIDMVESGELVVRSQGDAPVTRADGTEETSTGEDVTLAVGDMIYYPAEVGMYFENASEEPVVLLSAVVIPVGPDFVNERITWVDGEPSLEGVSYQKLGDGLVQEQPVSAAMWTIDQVELPAGVDVPAIPGIGMISPVLGNYSFTIDAGMVQVTRAESNMLQPNAVLDTSFSLKEADAAFFPNGVTATSRAEEQQPLTILMMNIEPAEGVAATPAELSFNAGDGTVAGNPGAAEAGQIVTTNADSLNLRAEASTESEVVTQLAAGVEVEILDGPVEAGDYVWYQVRVVSDGTEGWLADEFLDGVGAPEATEGDGTAAEATAEVADDTEASASASPEAAPGQYAVGSTVVTTEDGVRVRPSASTDEEAIDALEVGTELIVTGEQVDDGEFIWLPVETPDGWTGFVVIDFVEPAP